MGTSWHSALQTFATGKAEPKAALDDAVKQLKQILKQITSE